jgi:hypothetical protein
MVFQSTPALHLNLGELPELVQLGLCRIFDALVFLSAAELVATTDINGGACSVTANFRKIRHATTRQRFTDRPP